MPFFHYSQNNSGGSFDYDARRGITHHVVIEADSAAAADDRAESIGLYFDGDGDCPCCGERWGRAYGKGDDSPLVHGEPLTPEWRVGGLGLRWMKPNPEAVVHFRDGRIEWFLGDAVQEPASAVSGKD